MSLDEGGGRKAAARLFSYAMLICWFFSGNVRMRLPVALKYAFITAGAATQMVGSPTPPHGPEPPLGIRIDSTFGICAIRMESYLSKLVSTTRPSLMVHS